MEVIRRLVGQPIAWRKPLNPLKVILVPASARVDVKATAHGWSVARVRGCDTSEIRRL